ncbi:MAG: D-alanyl-D-alanine carboxypeptidase [Proteobacteria bacterium]|nr:D-alanyl-D-alanine carboxypeptidase [Pseudomonadota bacterium]
MTDLGRLRKGPVAAWILSITGALVISAYLAAPSAAAQSRYAELVVDGNDGRVLAERNADARKYPASLTKIMTLYMVFEALDKGKLSLEQPLKTSRRAAGQPASKLGLRSGDVITVRQAIMALVTKSANDAATVVAEAIAGSEFKFALMMTRRARDLGMSRTTFRNASGLPNRRQLSTARDMARLALAIRRDFPQHFDYFSETSFSYGGKVFRNHNNLVGNVQGVDGLKTGYIRASGFNLVATASRDEGRLVGVLFGGRSADSRDQRMRKLLANGFERLQRGGEQGLPSQFVRPRGRMDGFGHVPLPRYKPLPPTVDVATNADTSRFGIAWSVQIGAFDQVASARGRLRKLTGVLPDLLTEAKTSIDTVESGQAVFYRALVHGMNEHQAHELCNRIKSANFECLTIAPVEAFQVAEKNHG